MDYDGGFHEVETDGKLLLVYHHPKYRPIPQIKSTSSPDEAANQDHPSLPLFLCPLARARKDYHGTQHELWWLTSSPEYVISTTRADNRANHHVLPLFWCNNEKFSIHGGCRICYNSNLEKYATYVCLRCNFVAHRDCMYFPHTIKISRHNHRISHVSSLRHEKYPCGVCHQSIDGGYGAYTCHKCGDYAVHSRCALGKDVWDGEEMEGIPEKDEDDITQDAPPFCKISKGLIHYFLHDHHLLLEENILYDENKLCEACVMPIFEEKLYSCTVCDFILHETCLKAHRRIQHALHPHLLILKTINNISSDFRCDACWRSCGGFVYQCPKEECDFKLDVRCASISEPFDYQGHEDPLFLSLDPEKKLLCEVCKDTGRQVLNCIKCDFIVCMECATLPYKARYKNDKHFLTLSWGEEGCEKYWCDECENSVYTYFYWCNDCCTILHTFCLFGEDPYMKPGQCFELYRKKFQILAKRNISRPICHYCMKPCQGKIFKTEDSTTCSWRCASCIQ
ncbi:BnaA01g36140D [Brassica napus]|uniref:BnaA01g36140D protein n=1 Tax=Brassica napus TaxID=3708 RepID=A0A078IMK7_BRANA|nr:BnaA01g36140D [Brassica napus]